MLRPLNPRSHVDEIAQQTRERNAIANVPGVKAVAWTNQMPMSRSGSSSSVRLTADQARETATDRERHSSAGREQSEWRRRRSDAEQRLSEAQERRTQQAAERAELIGKANASPFRSELNARSLPARPDTRRARHSAAPLAREATASAG